MGIFRQWVLDYGGPDVVAKQMGKTRQAVQHWMSGFSHPRAKDLPRLIKLSKGKLTLEDILNSSKVGRWPKAGK